MPEQAYWSYWKHKLEQLWKEVEELKNRVDDIEAKLRSSRGVGETAPQPPVVKASGEVKAPGIEDPVLKILKERGSMNIVDINLALKDMGVEESVRDTLFKRIKKLMEKGLVGFDESTQTFFVR